MFHISRNIGQEGALVDVFVAVHTARSRMLEKHGMPVPLPRLIKAQVDTGSHRSTVDTRIFQELQLWGEIDREEILTSSTEEDAPHTALVHVANLMLTSAAGDRLFETLPVLAHSFGASEEARGLIGRDILDLCHFTYDGPGKVFQLKC